MRLFSSEITHKYNHNFLKGSTVMVFISMYIHVHDFT